MQLDLKLAEAGLNFTQCNYQQAELGFKEVLALEPFHPLANSGLFNTLWAKNSDHSRTEAQQLLQNFLNHANRDDPEVKPVAANFIKIKIALLQKDEWLLEK